MRSDGNLQNYYHTIVKKAVKPPQIQQLSLPRKRKRPNYSILQYIEGHQSAESHYLLTVEDRYR